MWLVSIHAPDCPVSLQLKHDVFVFSVSSIIPAVQNFSTVLYLFSWCPECRMFFKELLTTIFPLSLLYKSTINEHPLFNRIDLIHMLGTCCLWLTTHDQVPISHLLLIRGKPCGLVPLRKLSWYFPMLGGHDWRYSLYRAQARTFRRN